MFKILDPDDELSASLELLRDEVNDSEDVSGYRCARTEEQDLSSELKTRIRRNIQDWETVEALIEPLSPRQLLQVENFLWSEALSYAEHTLQQKLTREFITSRMEPTANYHRRQMCGEPLIACRANYCIHSNPACASRKLKEHIRSIVTVFDRRSARTNTSREALNKFLQHVVQKFGIFGVILSDERGAPVAAASDLDPDSADASEHSVFSRMLLDYVSKAGHTTSEGQPVSFELNLKAVSHMVDSGGRRLLLTVLSQREYSPDLAVFHASMGINRILSEDQELQTYAAMTA